MAYVPPPTEGIPREGNAENRQQQHLELASGLQNLSLNNNPSKSKKKRSARAYHTEFNSPDVTQPSTPFQPQHQSISQPQLHAEPVSLPYSGQMHTGLMQAFTAPDPAHAQNEQQNLSLSSARFHHQQEYMTPVSEEDGTYKSFFTFQNIVPPTAGTQYHTVDQGTSSSKFMRSSMYNVPETEQLRNATKLPLSVTIRPFAPLLATEEPIPVVDMQSLGFSAEADPLDVGPPRCRRCRTYMNPAMQHTTHNRFVCNICQFPNNTIPDDYISMVNPVTGARTDASIRPELHKGIYDIIVPKQYNVGGSDTVNHELHHVFLIDISEQSVRQHLPVLVADTIRATLYSLDYDEQSETMDPNEPQKKFPGKFAIITFDKRLQFYNLSPSLDSTQLSISSDLEDPFVPFNEGLFADPEESRICIEDALNNLEQLSSNENVIADPEPCFAAAVRTAMLCLESVGGGKITSVLSSLPSWGPGSLTYKDRKNVGRSPTPEQEKAIYNPDNEYYQLLAKDMISRNVGLECLVVSPTAVDLSNIGWLCSVSGGSVYKWSNFNFERDSRSFTARFINSIRKSRGYQGQLKLRCSNGLQVTQYYGTSSAVAEASVVGAGTQDPIIPVLNEDQTFTVLLQYDGKLNTKYDCHFQAGLLYTDPSGIRKVRVINLVLAVSETLDDVFNFVEQDSVVTTIVRDTLSFVGKQTLHELRESVNEKLVEVFTQYRAMSELGHNRHRTLTNQLLFPDSLKHLPMYMLAFIKSKALRDSTALTADTRLADIFQFLNMPVERLVYHLCPALVELHTLEQDDCMVPDEGTENPDYFIKLPQYKDLSYNQLDGGVYILCNGLDIFVWIHPNANILLIKDLFGDDIDSIDQINPLIDEIPDLPTHISQQARNLVKFFQTEITGSSAIGSAGIQIVRLQIDGAEVLFKDCLIEDNLKGVLAANSGAAYPEYLSNLHKAIRVKLENDKSSNRVRQSVSTVEHHQDTLAQRLIHF
ncbi:uncharacterized protein AC631_03590 [Debaryomyces fabryi]|uniref:SED5-binding protein 3 n=1 Tax=Debaryomyces fabryi TaxID=58627 RepID=A0A0V1PWM6_9ASCO|nr:uncharacterized protein AC631_03590 [Debaryomyces fabryi]KSA00654.1 hypothetical protein AC631_03590 [Debaryomyces fabryi]CUM45939.1 unnamed protein product [Debaryomyces fabryi]